MKQRFPFLRGARIVPAQNRIVSGHRRQHGRQPFGGEYGFRYSDPVHRYRVIGRRRIQPCNGGSRYTLQLFRLDGRLSGRLLRGRRVRLRIRYGGWQRRIRALLWRAHGRARRFLPGRDLTPAAKEQGGQQAGQHEACKSPLSHE